MNVRAKADGDIPARSAGDLIFSSINYPFIADANVADEMVQIGLAETRFKVAATASLRSFDRVRKLGASQAYDDHRRTVART